MPFPQLDCRSVDDCDGIHRRQNAFLLKAFIVALTPMFAMTTCSWQTSRAQAATDASQETKIKTIERDSDRVFQEIQGLRDDIKILIKEIPR